MLLWIKEKFLFINDHMLTGLKVFCNHNWSNDSQGDFMEPRHFSLESFLFQFSHIIYATLGAAAVQHQRHVELPSFAFTAVSLTPTEAP